MPSAQVTLAHLIAAAGAAVLFAGAIRGQAPQSSPNPPASASNPAIFEKTIPRDQLSFLANFAGAESGQLFKDKQFHKLMGGFVPDCTYHYGRDMPLDGALDMVFTRSPVPVFIRDSRYVSLASHRGPYLGGRAFLWLDMQDGIGVGVFFFRPTNGEPTPAVTVFSKQVKEKTLRMGQLPAAFGEDFAAWLAQSSLPPVTTRYFINGSNKRILLEHDEDYCLPANGVVPPPDCQQMNADAADMDLNAAYYLEHVHYASNATAWMLSGPALEWIEVRNSACRSGPDPLGCRIRLTRERTRQILNHRIAAEIPHR